MNYYNNNIQIHKNVIKDIFNELKPTTKMLVFGLGYDSLMWYFGNNENTYFIENKQEYIDLNKNISMNNIIKYDYADLTVEKSFKLTDEDLDKYPFPDKLKTLGKFDIIIIDGPEGYNPTKTPGRILPIYWSYKFLSDKNTLIYIDDSNRDLEKHCIQKYFKNNIVKEFTERGGTVKIIV
jgi:hypothetical protein